MNSKAYQPPQSIEELLQRYSQGERYFAYTELDTHNFDFQNLKLEEIDFSHSYTILQR